MNALDNAWKVYEISLMPITRGVLAQSPESKNHVKNYNNPELIEGVRVSANIKTAISQLNK